MAALLLLKAAKREQFYAAYIPHQNWTFRNSIVNYITKNPSSAKVHQKLAQSCKYFFIKNPIIVVESLDFTRGYGATGWYNKKGKFIFNEEIGSYKYWITENLYAPACKEAPNRIASLIPRIYQIDAKKLYFSDQTFSFTEILFLCSNAQDITFRVVTIIKAAEDGSIVLLENIVAVLSKIKKISFQDNPNASSITSNTVKKLLELSHFSKIDIFNFWNIPEPFDINTFFIYIKKNKHTKFSLHFHHSISHAYRNRLNHIVDEIVAKTNHNYKPPLFNFEGINIEKYMKMSTLFKHP